MNILFSKDEYENATTFEVLPLKCELCGNVFYKRKQLIVEYNNKTTHKKFLYCNKECQGKAQRKRAKVTCVQCNKELTRKLSQIRVNNFCSRSCAATHQNTHKSYGTRRSKLERWLEEQLIVSYPNIEFHFNRKDTINSELDIYIPAMKLAFELNGIFHYEPIFGKDKLNEIQNNDNRKFQACLERGIELCILDVSSIGYLKKDKTNNILSIIKNIINLKLSTQ